MRYFVLKQDDRITDMPYAIDFFEKIDVRSVSAAGAGAVPTRTLINIRPSGFTVFPDVLCSPVLLVTDEAKDVIQAFDEYLVYREVVYLDAKNESLQLYFMPMMEIVDCLSEKSEYVNVSRGAFSKVVLKRAPIRDKALFLVKNNTQRVCIMRLDLAESLLGRDCKGFTLEEAGMDSDPVS
ncbi:MAG: hypothetical protein FWH28_08290 [Clostridiales bacterium]|nr:hypothetical protein [Clostridiales bacterium]